MPCVALCVGATMKESESAWQSPIFQLTNSTRPQQWQQQEAPASHTRSGKHTNIWFPLLGLTIVMTHRNIRCRQRSLFVTKTGGCTFHKSVGSYRFSMFFYSVYGLSFCHERDKHLPTKSWIKSYIICPLLPQVFIPLSILHRFPLRHRMQQAHHFLVAPLLRLVEGCLASLDRSWWRQCCCFSYTTFKLFVQWNDGLISCSFDFNLLKWDLHNSHATSAAHEVTVHETKPNSICWNHWNQWICRDCPLTTAFPPKNCFRFLPQCSRR